MLIGARVDELCRHADVIAGVFVLDMSATLAPDGQSYSGHFVTDSYDLDGNVIPALHAEGTVAAKRIGPNSPKW